MNFSIILPVFNEEKNIIKLNFEISSVINNLPTHKFELIYVDDCSKDNSYEELLSLKNNFPTKIIRHRINLSQSDSIRTGVEFSKYDNLIFLDSDLQNDPHDITKMVQEFQNGYDMIIGWRKNRKDSLSKKIPSMIANYLVRIFTRSKANDHGCAIKVLKKIVYDSSTNLGDFHRLLAAEAYNQGFLIKEVEVKHNERINGKSNYGIGRIPKVMLDLIYLSFMQSYKNKTLYFFGMFGFVSLVISFFIFFTMLYIKYVLGRSFILTPLPILATTFFIMAVNFLLIGILAQLNTPKKYKSTISVKEIRDL
jgi:glycosyltransferase involved in cell wall biosynthesis